MEYLNDHNTKDEEIDLRLLLFKVLRYWYLLALSTLIALGVAFFFNKYTLPKYKVSTTILIKENYSDVDAQDLIGFRFINNKKKIENEIGILNSYSLISRTIQNLDFDISYHYRDQYIEREMYQNSPIIVFIDKDYPQLVRTKFNVRIISDKRFELQVQCENPLTCNFFKYDLEQSDNNVDFSRIYNFGDTISHPLFKIHIALNNKYVSEAFYERTISFVLNDLDYLVGAYNNLKIEPINREASIISITMEGSNVKKMVAFLNSLTDEYLNRELEKKNEITRNTIEFISDELLGVSDSLAITERNLENFKSMNQVMNLNYQAQHIFEAMKTLENEKAVLLVKSKYYKNLKKYLVEKESIEDIAVPSSIGIEDPLLNSLIKELIILYARRTELLYSSTKKNPLVLKLDQQILNIKSSLLENVNSIIKTSDISVSEIDKRLNRLSRQIDHLPGTHRKLFRLERQFKLNDAIYTFLLQKLSEARITMASNRPDNELIDPARITQSEKVFPKKKMSYMVAFFIGMLIPLAYIFSKEYFNNRIVEKQDILNISKLPFLGYITHNHSHTDLVVEQNPKSLISELFRSVRTNIHYMVKGKFKPVIMVTSNIVGAGKTFISINLASAFAQYGKNTVLVGFDLRKPGIYKSFKLPNAIGLSTYYIGKSSLKEIIQKTSVSNLDVILAGPIPPNPSELIASEKTKELFDELQKTYEYIVIDTPPVGLVTDAFLLNEYADVSLFLIRQNYSRKKPFELIIKDIEQKQINNFGILMNDVKLRWKEYGYGYGYGYGKGYYTEDKNLKGISRIKKSFNAILNKIKANV